MNWFADEHLGSGLFSLGPGGEFAVVLFGSGIRLVEAPEGFHRGADTTYPPVVRAGYTRAASLQGLRGAQSGAAARGERIANPMGHEKVR